MTQIRDISLHGYGKVWDVTP